MLGIAGRFNHEPGSPVSHETMINLGCGTRLHDDWLNLDFSPLAKRARWPLLMESLGRLRIISAHAYDEFHEFGRRLHYADLRRLPLALPSNCATVVYHSNILEHFSRLDGEALIAECHRLLLPSGILRVVVPDLEVLVRRYFMSIEPSFKPALHDQAMHDLFDQMVRTQSGGSDQRLGLSLAGRIKRLAGLRPTPESLGELHKWMYDRFSLPRLLEQRGFKDIRVLDHLTSDIPQFHKYCLDTNVDGSEYKNDMLYVEARK